MPEHITRYQRAKAARDLTIAHVTNLSDTELPAFAHALAVLHHARCPVPSVPLQ